MSNFYRNLKTRSKVESLRQAHLEMIRGNVRSELLAQRMSVGSVSWAKADSKLQPLSPFPSLFLDTVYSSRLLKKVRNASTSSA
jgi:CHAT domain-containing protein